MKTDIWYITCCSCTRFRTSTQQQLEEYGFSFEACSLVPGAWSSKLGVSRIFSTSSSKACETAKLVLALVSTKRHPCWRANSCPCSLLTCLCDSCIRPHSMLQPAWCLGEQHVTNVILVSQYWQASIEKELPCPVCLQQPSWQSLLLCYTCLPPASKCHLGSQMSLVLSHHMLWGKHMFSGDSMAASD